MNNIGHDYDVDQVSVLAFYFSGTFLELFTAVHMLKVWACALVNDQQMSSMKSYPKRQVWNTNFTMWCALGYKSNFNSNEKFSIVHRRAFITPDTSFVCWQIVIVVIGRLGLQITHTLHTHSGLMDDNTHFSSKRNYDCTHLNFE